MKNLKTKAWPEGRDWPDELVLDVGSSMPTDVYGMPRPTDFGVLYIRHDLVPAADKAQKAHAIAVRDMNALNGSWEKKLTLCETRLETVRAAIRAHVKEFDSLMRGPATRERGEKLARSIGSLERSLLDSESNLKPPISKPSNSESTTKLRVPVSPSARLVRRQRKLRIS